MKKLLAVFILHVSLSAMGQIVVLDPANLEEALVQVMIASNQLFQANQLLKRVGDPAAIKQVVGAAQTLQQLAKSDVGKPLLDIQLHAAGASGLAFDGHGLYRAIELEVPLINGATITRPVEAYRKFDALQKAVAEFDAVTADTQIRRDALRAAQRQTTERLRTATTDAEAQKLKGLLAAQQSELAGVSAERSDAATRVLIQQAANEADRARQEQADQELRAASLQSALGGVRRFFNADSRPTLIPDPNQQTR